MKNYSDSQALKRLQESKEGSDLLFSANFSSTQKLEDFKQKVLEKDSDAEIIFFENKEVFG